ncbi:gluconate 2-dehydrogenase subunit 3 family protein [Virgibacillus sp. SK37]|uniref:gluconate 2-dehydrogenase subunit 3 family protein n=1 Tax=Virgibacillus sp. SK37 TaxID=403957 RepID=UPI0004D16C22|nr:gluconate 2-dehydrogenase subunit 3 family protein [Virgibacillus sp. SK37]AIF44285.1 dehydrogenase [Virgibacillus sp. SK37]
MANEKKGLSRRDFLKTTGIATGSIVGGGLIGGLIGYNMNDNGGTALEEKTGDTSKTGTSTRGRMFFSNDKDFKILSQATERIFPEDELGPGAIGLGVPYFIDNRLYGNYGNNSREYMQGPFFAGEATQGYQSKLTRAEIFTQGIQKMESEAESRFDTSFIELEGEQMDEILTDFQKDKIKMTGVSSAFFFKLLRQATLEGAYADPIYNGNNNMDGWRMKGFPGHQAAYINDIEKEKFMKMEPKSINSMH